MSYKKVDATNSPPAEVARVEALRAAGQLACDAFSHNDERGCDNPDCWKYNKDELWDALYECAECGADDHPSSECPNTVAKKFAVYRSVGPFFGDDLTDGSIVEIVEIDDGGTAKVRDVATDVIGYVAVEKLEYLPK